LHSRDEQLEQFPPNILFGHGTGRLLSLGFMKKIHKTLALWFWLGRASPGLDMLSLFSLCVE